MEVVVGDELLVVVVLEVRLVDLRGRVTEVTPRVQHCLMGRHEGRYIVVDVVT